MLFLDLHLTPLINMNERSFVYSMTLCVRHCGDFTFIFRCTSKMTVKTLSVNAIQSFIYQAGRIAAHR